MKIAFFDSGLGGLCVLNEIFRKYENIDFLYYADRANIPYGTKDNEEILNLTKKAVKFLISKGAKIIILACNTATSASINKLREEFNLPIIGMEPAVKLALSLKPQGRIILASTAFTNQGEKLSKLLLEIKNSDLVDKISLGELVKFAENNIFESDEVMNYLKDSLNKFNNHSYMVLGCTHFNYFKKSIKKILPSIKFVDGINGTINILEKNILNLKNAEQGNKISDKDAVIFQNIKFFDTSKKLDTDQIKNLFKILDDVKNI